MNEATKACGHGRPSNECEWCLSPAPAVPVCTAPGWCDFDDTISAEDTSRGKAYLEANDGLYGVEINGRRYCSHACPNVLAATPVTTGATECLVKRGWHHFPGVSCECKPAANDLGTGVDQRVINQSEKPAAPVPATCNEDDEIAAEVARLRLVAMQVERAAARRGRWPTKEHEGLIDRRLSHAGGLHDDDLR